MPMSTRAHKPEAAPQAVRAPGHRRPLRRGASLLPSLFTVANIGAGCFAILQASLALQSSHPAPMLDSAAKAIGWAVLLDGFDGRIARMVNAASAFGREFDSLADVISFGVAPALLAYVWGVRSLSQTGPAFHLLDHAAQIAIFLFVIAGAARLARFNISTSESAPSNPGKPGKRYFVGMPIPAGAGTLAAVIHFFASPAYFDTVNHSAVLAIAWLLLILLLAYFMVSTWRFYSFKEIDLRRRHPFVITVMLAALLAGLWYFSEAVLLALVILYAGSAIVWRLSHYLRRSRAAA